MLWIRIIYHEIFFGGFAHGIISTDAAPLISPFDVADSPDIIQFSLGKRRFNSLIGVSKDSHTSWFLADLRKGDSPSVSWLPLSSLRSAYQSFFTYSGLISGSRIHCLLLTDSSDAFAASHETNSRSLGRTARLNLHYLRDHLGIIIIISFSFVSAGFKIADAGTKQHSSSRLWSECCKTNRCRIGLLSGKDTKSLVHLVQPYESPRCGFVSL